MVPRANHPGVTLGWWLAAWLTGVPVWANPVESLEFHLGKALFERNWVAAPASTDSADGLGPLYNARSCAGCHPGGGRGRTAGPDGSPGPALVLRLSLPGPDGPGPEPVYGAQIQPLAQPGQIPEGRLALTWSETQIRLADGTPMMLRRPVVTLRDLGYGPLDSRALTAPRLAPSLTGLGILEAIPETAILARADPRDEDGDGISGRANRVRDPVSGSLALGRFGWKAGQSNLAGQVATAFALDLGLSTLTHPAAAGDCTPRQPACLAAPKGDSPRHGGVEVGTEVAALVTGFVRALPVPPRRDPADPEVQAGAAIFLTLGCASCHLPDHGPDPGQARLYTDLLLHDLGEGLADGWTEGEAGGREWRTPALRGLGAAARADGGAWLHDGRAQTLLEAILWHGGEAQASRDRVMALPTSSRAKLMRFLESL